MIGKVVENLVNAKQPQSDFVKLMDSFKDPYLVLIAMMRATPAVLLSMRQSSAPWISAIGSMGGMDVLSESACPD